MADELFNETPNLKSYYDLQNSLRDKVIKEDQLPETVQYIAGVDVAYDDSADTMIGAIVVLDAITLKVVEKASHEMKIAFPYISGLFSFREIPPLIEAFKKLILKPDIIVCDAQGIAHPKGVGMATHLGLELDLPTIGCAKKILIGNYDKSLLGLERGATLELTDNGLLIGKAVRTQANTNPMFVSIGHKISLETAISWVLKLTPNFRLPETTREADHLVNALLKNK